MAKYCFILIIVQPTAYLLRKVDSVWTVPQGNGLIETDKDNDKVLGIKDGGLVGSVNDEKDGTQEWTVTTVEKDSGEELYMFSIDDWVLTGNWKINVQGNVFAETIVGCIMCIATYFKTKIGH